MRLRPTDRVLELGCGPGYFSAELCRAVPKGEVVLLEVQPQMLALASSRLRAVANVKLTQGDAAALPFPNGSFDAALLVYVLGEVPDRQRCLAELARVLRPGGSITFVETWRDSDFIPFGSLRPDVERCGFALAERFGCWSYTARFIKQGNA